MKPGSHKSIMEKFHADPKIPLHVREREIEIYNGAQRSEFIAIAGSLTSAFIGVAVDAGVGVDIGLALNKPVVVAIASGVTLVGVGVAALAGYYMESTSQNIQKQYNIR